MDGRQQIDAAKNLLDLVMSFFSRVESKASVILGIDTAMLALLSSTAPPLHALGWRTIIIATISGLLLLVSIGLLLIQLLPQLKGGQRSSLIYFRDISSIKECQFIKEFLELTDEAYAKELLSQ